MRNFVAVNLGIRNCQCSVTLHRCQSFQIVIGDSLATRNALNEHEYGDQIMSYRRYRKNRAPSQ